MMLSFRAEPSHAPHGHRTWLHLLPQDPEHVPDLQELQAAVELLAEMQLAILDPETGLLLPGPAFARLLTSGRLVPLAGAARGEVRLEAGVLRCYPDPGPEGFDTKPLHGYRADCPGCGVELEFFALSFPTPDPMQAVCPGCGKAADVSSLVWSPTLPVARAELTFGPLAGRPSLRGTELFRRLESAWETPLREVHVTL